MRESGNIGLNGVPGRKHSNFIGYVIIPADVDRDLYVKNCLNTNTVSIQTENADFHHKVPVGLFTINQINFPSQNGELGSPVLLNNIMPHNKPVVVDVFNFRSDFQNLEENEMKLEKKQNNNHASLSLRGKVGQIGVSASGDSENSGKITVKATNATGSASIDLFSNGSLSLKANDDISTISYETINICLKDSLGQERSVIKVTDSQITIDSEVIQLFDGKESMVLGDSLVDLLNDLIGEIASSTVVTQLGTQPLINAAEIAAFQAKTDAIKSQKGKLS